MNDNRLRLVDGNGKVTTLGKDICHAISHHSRHPWERIVIVLEETHSVLEVLARINSADEDNDDLYVSAEDDEEGE